MFNSERARGAYILELSGAGLQREGRDQRWPSREAQRSMSETELEKNTVCLTV